MNKKILLGIGSLAAAALPVSVVVACNSDTDKKDAVVTVASPTKVKATVAGSSNAYTLTYVNGNDTASKAELETAFKGMVKKAAKDDKTVTFAGAWDTAFDGTTDGTYIYTVAADGYNSVTFTVSVTPATWAWDKTLPAGPYYETATAGEYTTDKTQGNGYAVGTPGTVANIATPSATTTITIDGTTYTYNTAGALTFEKWFSTQSQDKAMNVPANVQEITDPTNITNLTSGNAATVSALQQAGFTSGSKSKLYINADATTVNVVKQAINPSATLKGKPMSWAAFKALPWNNGDKIFFYDGETARNGKTIYVRGYFIKAVAGTAGWDKTLPSKLYKTSTQKTYTIDETKANGYAAEKMPTVTKTQAQFETQIKTAPTSNTVKIDNTTYTYTKQ